MTNTITINTPATPAYVGVVLERAQNFTVQPGSWQPYRMPPFSESEALAILSNLAIQCEDENARAFFRGLHSSLK